MQATPSRDSDPEDGARVLDEVCQFLKRFVAYPNDASVRAHALWIAHTHAMSCWESTPRLAFLSPESGSGKSRALEVTELLVPKAIQAVNTSPAYLFRKVSDPEGPPTILFDEIDTVFGPKARENEDVRGFINAGHRRGAVAGRCTVVSKVVTTEELPAYCALAMAGIGHLPDTILTRSLIVRMRRRSRSETVEPFRRRNHAPDGHRLRDELANWVSARAAEFEASRPLMPPGVEDRAADVWEALLAIADAAAGAWPTQARSAAAYLVGQAKEVPLSLGLRLLADVRTVFGTKDACSTEALLEGLWALEESPWGDLRGKPLDARRLATLLREYEIHSKTLRIGTIAAKGYARIDLFDAWSRYLSTGDGCVTSVTSVTS